MKNILSKIKINSYTYFFIFICLICGYIKNICIIFTICLIHELGHIVITKIFHFEIVKIEILPFGGYTTINKKINSNINYDLLIACGGFISQFILLILVFLFKNHFNILTYHLIIEYNLILIIFNMLPIIPLDGSRILELLLEKYFSYHKAYHLIIYISIIIIVLFIFINYHYKLDNYFIITFLIYNTIIYFINYKYMQKRFLLERYLYDLNYQKIDNKTKNIKDLKKNVYHYFKENNHYVNEKVKIKESLYLKGKTIDK